MHLTRICFASLLLLACYDALAQDESLIDDLPQTRKGAAPAKPQPRKPNGSPQPSTGHPPRVPQPRVGVADDVIVRERTAAEHGDALKTENAIPDTLAEALARALHNSPAILVADAKLRQAQAEWNEARQSVVHDLTLAFKRRELNKAIMESRSDATDDVRQAFLEDEAKIIYLLGVAAELPDRADTKRDHLPRAGLYSPVITPSDPDARAAEQNPMGGGGRVGSAASAALDSSEFEDLPDHLRSFLNKRIDFDFTEVPLREVLDYIQQAGGAEIDFVLQNPTEWNAPDADKPDNRFSVTAAIKHVTVAAALEALADLNGCAFIFRDYGILVISPANEGRSLESYRSSGARMIAPPKQANRGGGGMMGGSPSGMGGPAPRRTVPPANSAQ